MNYSRLIRIFTLIVAVISSSMLMISGVTQSATDSMTTDDGDNMRYIGSVSIDSEEDDEENKPIVAGDKVSVYFLTEENCTFFYEYMVNEDCKSVSIINSNSGGCKEITIPGEVEHNGQTLPITKISDKAFALKNHAGRFGTEDLEKLIISEGIEEIGESAFMYATSLKEIVFPKSLKTIGFAAFGECWKLKSISFPENSELKSMSDGAFINCRDLEYVELPASLENITFDTYNKLHRTTPRPFLNCDSIKSIKVAPGNKFFKSEGNRLYTIDGILLYPNKRRHYGM